MIIAVASRKASPGVTSLAAWLAWFWPDTGGLRLIVEADASGGTLAARWSAAHGLTWDPGLLTLSTTRAGLGPAQLARLAQPVANGVLVAAAPPAPDQVTGALTRWGQRGPDELAGLAGTVTFADCGRLTASAPGLTLATRATLTVLVCRPRLDEVQALLPAVPELRAAGCTLGLVCSGDGPYPPAEIAAATGVPLLGVLPHDPGPAAVFDRDGFTAGRAFRRSRLAASLTDLAGVVHGFATARPRLVATQPPPAGTGPEPGVQAPSPSPPSPAPPPFPPPPGHRIQAPEPLSPAVAAARARRVGAEPEGSTPPGEGDPPVPRSGPPPMPTTDEPRSVR